MKLLSKVTLVQFLVFLNYFFRLIGLSNISIRRSVHLKAKKTGLIFVPSRLAIVYSAMMMCVLVVVCCAGSYSVFTNVYKYKVSLFQVVDFSQLIMGTLTIIFVLFVYCLKVKKFVSILQSLHNVYDYLVGLDILDSANPLFLYIACVFLFNVIVFAIFISSGLMFYPTVVIFAMNFMPNFVTVCLVLQYAFIVRVIFFMFDNINKAISRTFKAIVEKFPYQINGKVYTVSSLKDREILSLLQNAHVTLCNLSQQVSTFYDVSILISVVFMFYTIVVYTYFLLVLALDGNVLFTVIEYVQISLWDLCFLCALLALARNVTKTLNEVNRTNDIVFELSKYVKNQEHKKMLKEFAQYLLHKKVTFTAMDFFSLECSLLTSIINSILTYLVILIQFQLQNWRLNS